MQAELTRSIPTPPSRPGAPVLWALVLLALATTGCRQGLYDQAKYEPYEASPLFADGTSARTLPAHTVPRGHLREDVGYYTGKDETGAFVNGFPMTVDRQLLERGEERYTIFCSVCHGASGEGDGMIVQRGYKKPTSYHEGWVRYMPIGFYVNAIYEGYGVMPSYASQVPPADRWAIAAYIRTLQTAREVPVSELAAEQQAELEMIAPDTASGPEASGPTELP